MNKKFKKVLIIFVVLVITCLAVGDFLFLHKFDPVIRDGNANMLTISLNGEANISLNYKETYKDEGATASYGKKDITDSIVINNNVDYDHIGEYKYTYSIKYKKQEKKVIRTIKIVDNEKPEIELLGNAEISIIQDNKYTDPGVKAVDNYDGDISNKVEIDMSSLDVSKPGEYIITYKIKDSSGNENQTERKIIVNKKVVKEQKVAVLNYHFFYSRDDEKCDQIICLHKDKFREQLKYLKENGFYTLTIKEFRDWMYGEYNIPEKSVLITVDDGGNGTNKETGNYLGEALREYQLHATLFVITGWWGPDNYDTEYLDLQSHSYLLHYDGTCGYRSKLNCVSYDELLNDLKLSIDVVKDKTSFCFPYYETTETSLRAVKEAGFDIAFVGDNRKASRSDNKYKIPRYVIHKSITLDKFKSMVN